MNYSFESTKETLEKFFKVNTDDGNRRRDNAFKVGAGGLVVTLIAIPINIGLAVAIGLTAALFSAGVLGYGEYNKRATPLKRSPIIPVRIHGQYVIAFNPLKDPNKNVLRIAYVPESDEERNQLVEVLGDGSTIQDLLLEPVVYDDELEVLSEDEKRCLTSQVRIVTNLDDPDAVIQLIEILQKDKIDLPVSGSVISPFSTLTAACPINFDTVDEICEKIINENKDTFNLGTTEKPTVDINAARDLLVEQYLSRSAKGRRSKAHNALFKAYRVEIELFFDGTQDSFTKGFRKRLANTWKSKTGQQQILNSLT